MQKIKIVLLFIFILCTALSKGINDWVITPNLGQYSNQLGETRNDITAVVKTPHYNLAFKKNGLSYYFYKVEDVPNEFLNDSLLNLLKAGNSIQGKKVSYLRFDVDFNNAEINPTISYENITGHISNYFLGQLPEPLQNIPSYQKITYHNIYPNIDFVFYVSENKLKYDVVVKPGADPNIIEFIFPNENSEIRLSENTLQIQTQAGTYTENIPSVYELENPSNQVLCDYIIENQSVKFNVSKYDTTKTLIIDPVITWSTYFNGGYSNETWTNPVFDDCSNMYGVAYTYSTVFPTLNAGGNWFVNVFDNSFPNITELVFVKFNASGELIWSTYYGGNSGDYLNVDYGKNLAIDGLNRVYITGRTSSSNFPLLNAGGSSYFESSTGNDRGFILCFNENGNRLWATMFNQSVASTMGNGSQINGVVADASGNLYFTGQTYRFNNNDIPLANPGGGAYYQSTFNGTQCITMGKFNANHQLVWGTYVNHPATNFEQGHDIDIDLFGNVFMIGRSSINNGLNPNPAFIITNPGGGAYIQNLHGSPGGGGATGDMVIMKFKPDLSLHWSTLYGGNGGDIGSHIETDKDGNVYIVGRGTNSTDFPVLNPGGGAFYNGTSVANFASFGIRESFLLCFDNNGVRKWATYVNSGTEGNTLFGIGLDNASNLYVSGYCKNDFPVVNHPGYYFQSSNLGINDGVFMKFDENFKLKWSTYFGGSDNESFYVKPAVFQNICGDTIFATFGNSKSTDFPVQDPLTGAWMQSSIGSGASTSSVLVRFLMQNNSDSSHVYDTTVCNSANVLLDATRPGATYVWQDGSTDSTYLATTSDTFWVDITYNCCTYRDSFIVTILEPPIKKDTIACATQPLLLNALVPGATYLWHDGSSNASLSVSQEGVYWVDITVQGCTKRDTFTVEFYKSTVLDTTICSGNSIVLTPGYSGATYIWQDLSTNTQYLATDSGKYWSEVNINGCIFTDSFYVAYYPSGSNIDTFICEGDYIVLNSYTIGATYQWFNGDINPFLVVDTPGVFWVDVFISSCSYKDSFIVQMNPVISYSKDTFICNNQNILLQTFLPGAYLWNDGSTSTSFFNTNTEGIYWVDVTQNGCTNRDSFIVFSYKNNLFDTLTCSGYSINLQAQSIAGGTYLWQDGVTNGTTYQATQDGIYWVDIQIGTCLFRDSFSVQYTSYQPSVLDTLICSENINLPLSVYTPGVSNYSWNTLQNTPNIQVNQSGIYWVDISFGSCVFRDSFIVSSFSDPNNIDTTICLGNSITLDAEISAPGTSYIWNNGNITPEIFISSPGTYWVDISNQYCVKRDSFIVNTYSGNYKDTTVCSGTNVQLEANYFSAVYVWQDMITNASTFLATQDGVYWVDVTILGCTFRDSFVVSYYPALGDVIDTSFCSGDMLMLNAFTPGATNYLWNNANTNAFIFVSSPGIYYVDITLSGCAYRDSFIVSYFSPPAPNTFYVNGCPSSGAVLDASDPIANNYFWSNGQTSAINTVYYPGTYTAQIYYGSCYKVDTFIVQFSNLPQGVNISIDLCPNNYVLLYATPPGAIYTWQDGTNDAFHLVQEPGIYWVDVQINECIKRDTFEVVLKNIYAGGYIDTLICSEKEHILNAFVSNAENYEWNTGETTSAIIINSSNLYIVNYLLEGCFISDSFLVSFYSNENGLLGSDTAFCKKQEYLLQPSIFNVSSYEWSTGDTTAYILAESSGNYWVNVTTSCGILMDTVFIQFNLCECSIYIPNAFTPDDNKLNDTFKTFISCPVKKYLLTIHDRWGELLFQSTDPNLGWDGTYNAKSCQDGVYTYKVQVTYQHQEQETEESILEYGRIILLNSLD